MTDLDFKTIGKKIKERRTAQGITQESIATHNVVLIAFYVKNITTLLMTIKQHH